VVQFAYIGAVNVGGLTELEARDLISSKLAHFVKNPQVTLRVQAFRSRRVYMDGEVRSPGLFVLNDVPMTLVEAINRAGGFTPLADRSSVDVIRDGKSTTVSIPDLIARGVNPSAVMLKDGDMVRVLGREDSKVFVLGEVTRPTTLFLRNGQLTLNEALGDAGGLNPSSAEGKQVFVVRREQAGQPEIYHLDASSPTALALAEGFPLKAKDVVFVDAAPVVRWSRVVGLLVPGAEAAYFGKTASN
jgi:polysaccharide export outer membrane protein